jgi:AsmA family protein
VRLSTVLKLAAVGALLLVVALVQVVKSIDVDKYRDALAQAAKAATGRNLVVKGKLSLKMSLTPVLVVSDLELANAPWSSRPAMVTVDRVQADIALLPLLMREVRINRLVLTGTHLLLERDRQGRSNWALGLPAAIPPASFVVGSTPTDLRVTEVRFEDVQVLYKDDVSGTIDGFRLDKLSAQADDRTAPIGVTAAGTWDGRRFDVSAILGTVGDLLTAGKPIPVKMKAVLPKLVATANGKLMLSAEGPRADYSATAESSDIADPASLFRISLPPLGAGRIVVSVTGPLAAPTLTSVEVALGRHDAVAVAIKGTVADPMAGKGVDLTVSADGDNLAGFNKSLDLSLPPITPVKLTAHLTDVPGGWKLGDLKGTLGHSDIAGDAVLRLTAGRRPTVESHLASSVVDIGELLGNPAVPASLGEGRMVPDQVLPLSALSAVNGSLSWSIDRLVDGGLSAQQASIAATLANGKLSLTSSIGAVASGSVTAEVTLDAAASPPQAAVSLSADKVNLGELLKALYAAQGIQGATADLRLKLQGRGRSWRSIAARLNGDSALILGKASLADTNSDLFAVDVIKHLASWNPQESTDMRCLVSRFSVSEGMMRSEALVLDINDLTVMGQGSINLANEELDLTLVPRPKDPSSLTEAVPLDIGGSLGRPKVATNKGAIVKNIASAAGNGGSAAAGALVTLAGAEAESNSCLAAIVQLKKAPPPVKKAPPPAKTAGKAVRSGRAVPDVTRE